MYTVLITIFLLLLSKTYSVERRVRYISVERPHLEYNRKYFSFANFTSRRFGRQNPMYYVDLHLETLVNFGNNILMQFSFHKDQSNGHRQQLMDVTRKLCDLLEKDQFFGRPMRQGKLLGSCPYKPDDYHLYNMTVPIDAIPPNFPHFKGMIYANVTNTRTKEFVVNAWVSMEVKTLKIKEP